jgi:hypothetical protein
MQSLGRINGNVNYNTYLSSFGLMEHSPLFNFSVAISTGRLEMVTGTEGGVEVRIV